MDKDEDSLGKFFSDEATFHLSGLVNKHNIQIWRSESSRLIVEH